MKSRGYLLISSIILFQVLTSDAAVAGIGAEYNAAFQTYKSATTKAEIEQAAERFLVLADRKDADALKANALYWAAECWYDLKEWMKALNSFEKVLLIPGSSKEEAARFKVALCYARLGEVETAKWELNRFLRDFPSSSLVGRIRKELSDLSKVSQ